MTRIIAQVNLRRLLNPTVRNLINDNVIEFERALQLTDEQIRTLGSMHIRARLLIGEVTLNQVLDFAPRPQDPAPINHSQSTHTASVHRTVSESVSRLKNAYPHNKAGSITAQINCCSLRNIIFSLPDTPINQVAKRCIQRLIVTNLGGFKDPSSDTDTRTLLALIYSGTIDNNKRKCSKEDARDLLVTCLCDIQRGKNRDITGSDKDLSICNSGIFNKLTEALNGIHSDVDTIFITHETAALKLIQVSIEEAMRYITRPQNSDDYNAIIKLLPELIEDGIEVIWDKIKETISQRIFDEFQSLYNGHNDPAFVSLISAGTYVDLPNLESIQEQIIRPADNPNPRLSQGPGLFSSPSSSSSSPAPSLGHNPGGGL